MMLVAGCKFLCWQYCSKNDRPLPLWKKYNYAKKILCFLMSYQSPANKTPYVEFYIWFKLFLFNFWTFRFSTYWNFLTNSHFHIVYQSCKIYEKKKENKSNKSNMTELLFWQNKKKRKFLHHYLPTFNF